MGPELRLRPGTGLLRSNPRRPVRSQSTSTTIRIFRGVNVHVALAQLGPPSKSPSTAAATATTTTTTTSPLPAQFNLQIVYMPSERL